jgi:hypothetical protein
MRQGEELRPIKGKRSETGQYPCAFPGCGRRVHAKELCIPHRKQQLRGKELMPIRGEHGECTVEGCTRKVSSKGHCQTHAKYRLAGKELIPIRRPKYRYVDSHGYVRLKDPDHPNAGKNGLVGEHIKVMAGFLGRPLLAHEEVHHKNGQRSDNRLTNLELWSYSQPKGQRVRDKLEWARQIIEQYAPIEDKL